MNESETCNFPDTHHEECDVVFTVILFVMPNQRAIAAALGVHQTTVSLALRGDPSIPEETRRRVEQAAVRLGYRPNAWVTSLMAHIRSGRVASNRGCIAILLDARDEADAFPNETYRQQYEGMVARAEATGFRMECFYLQARGMDAGKIDRILTARGINGLVLAAPKRSAGEVAMNWARYACASVAHSWETPDVHRVSTDHQQNVNIVFRELLHRGYRRIGIALAPEAGTVRSFWLAQLLLWQHHRPAKDRVPIYPAVPHLPRPDRFRAWYRKWKPDALVCLLGEEQPLVEAAGLRVPEDIAMVCLNRPSRSRFSGTEENHRVIGANVVDLVAGQILKNEYGLPEHPTKVLVKGTWVEGETIRANAGRGKRA
ncbi:transcriptional regulator [Opitutaceae bacterium TAV1]|nr:transcriptional regulator [Opitutaceae bacterium TAV1]